MRLPFSRWLLLAALVYAAGGQAAPQAAYPDKPIKIILSTPAGGPLDVMARMSSEAASKSLGQPIVIENRPGASGAIAVSYLLKQPPDGYTLYMTADASFNLIPLVRNMNYKPVDDFSFIGNLVFAPEVFAVPAANPARTLKDFVAQARAAPGQLNYGMMLGVPQHLDFERFKRATGTDVVLVPFTGGSPIAMALLSDQVQATLMNASLLSDWIRQGKMRGLATTARKRMASLPDIPTMAEAGFGDLQLDEGVSYMLVGPRGMKKEVVDRIYGAYRAAVQNPELAGRLETMGFSVDTRSGEAVRADIQRALPENEKLVRALNIKLTD